ncbi:MAG: hypothetical protein K2Q10_03660 [Rhodospirillales bacterium]|nr:hypothetical protein [Rhodospirillales bacterium]
MPPVDMPRLTAEELAEMQARAEKATPGPWEVLMDPAIDTAWLNAATVDDDRAIALFDYRDGERNLANAIFSARARTDLPRLVAEIRSLRERVQALLQANSKEVDRRSQAQRERDEALTRLAELEKQ